MGIEEDLAQSRKYEMRTYIRSMRALYETAVLKNGELYDIASSLTGGFSNITKEAILADSRIIKILRYTIAPTISQMKFGQYFGYPSVALFEEGKLATGSNRYRHLTKIAAKIATFVSTNLDRSRFIWLNTKLNPNDRKLAESFTKKWTCSIAADQNAQTAYRNWRKELQEQEILANLISSGFIKSLHRGLITKSTDIGLGEYTQEIRVKGRTIQKADVVFRSKKTRRLVLVEAKAVGVELDATKRIKECCDKANDWASSADLDSPLIVAVIAGFFTQTNIRNLQASGVRIVWEHRLSDLREFL